MVVMGVGEEDDVDAGERRRVDRRLPAKMCDPAAEHGVRDDEGVVESDRGAAVPQPRQRCSPPLGA
jgi:hypothetical protein